MEDPADSGYSSDTSNLVTGSSDARAFDHLQQLTDAVHGGPVTETTTLTNLHNGTDALLHDLTGVADPYYACRVTIGDEGEAFGPVGLIGDDGEYHFRLGFSYNKLLLAPSARVVCDIRPSNDLMTPWLRMVLDFHFCAHGDTPAAVTEFKTQFDPSTGTTSITFLASRATCAGFNKVEASRGRLGPDCDWLVQRLRDCINPSDPERISVALTETKPSDPLKDIHDRLPGGRGPRLDSLDGPQYAMFDFDNGTIDCGIDQMKSIHDLTTGPHKLPMVRYLTDAHFDNVQHAAVELAYSATWQHLESSESIRMWAGVAHKGALFRDNDRLFLSAKFENFRNLGRKEVNSQIRLPKEFRVEITIQVESWGQEPIELSGFLTQEASPIRHQDALFRITSEISKDLWAKLRWDAHDPTCEEHNIKYSEVRFEPQINTFPYKSQLATVNSLQNVENKRWLPILLNQDHSTIETVNLGEHEGLVDAEEEQKLFDWLLNWKVWNQEQLDIIHSIHATKGAITVVSGPAGTGKTLLNIGLSRYFYELGFHILMLTPANSNANHIARGLGDVSAELKLEFLRLYPRAKEEGTTLPDEAEAEDAADGRKAHSSTRQLGEWDTFLDHRDAFARAYGIEPKVWERLQIIKAGTLLDDKRFDHWKALDEYTGRRAAGTLYNYDHKQRVIYNNAYISCRDEVVSRSRFIVTTTGNVRCQDMINNWAKENGSRFGYEFKGVFVFVDEAAKDVEVNVWSGIVCPEWSNNVKGVYLFGDELQLRPTNTSAHGEIEYNPFRVRLDVSLPSRLVQEGFPCFRLKEQHRMHHVISSPVRRLIYNGELRDGSSAYGPLDAKLPGLKATFDEIVGSFRSPGHEHGSDVLTDAQARQAWFEVAGTRKRASHSNKSMLVQEHVDLFSDVIYTPLKKYFRGQGKALRDHVMIIAAYNAQLTLYKQEVADLMRRDRTLTDDDIPRIETVDASQGQEADIVILDGSFQRGDQVGFMVEKERTNVAISRAREVMWMIGGSMKCRPSCPARGVINEYKKEMDENGRVHRGLIKP